MRDVTLEDTFYIDFTTRAFATGIPTVLAGSPALSVLEENNATPITAGVAVAVSRASVVGLNMATIVATDANGYETGKGYSVYISTGTVGGVSVVGEVVGQFTIGKSAAFIRIGAAGAGLTAINLPNQTMDITGDITGNLSGTVGSVTGAVGSVTGAVGSLGATAKSDVQTECDTSLATIHLDHLLAVDAADVVVDDSVIARMTSKAATADWSDFDNTTDSLEAVRDRGDAAWITGAGGSDRLVMNDTTIAVYTSNVSFTLAGGSVSNDAYNNCACVIEGNADSTIKSMGTVSDYVGSTKTITLKFDPNPAVTFANTDKIYILAEASLKSSAANRQLDVTATGAAGIDWANVENPTTALDLSATDIQKVDTTTTNTDMVAAAPTAVANRTEMDSNSTQLTAIVADTNELQGDDVPTLIAALPTAVENRTELDSNSTQLTAIVADTNELQGDDVPTLIAAVQSDTDNIQTRIPASLVAGRIDASIDATGMESGAVATILTTAMTEAYNTDGSAPTIAEALCLIIACLTEFAISSTTITCKKLDGSTTAATYTLDSATVPTSRTRAS